MCKLCVKFDCSQFHATLTLERRRHNAVTLHSQEYGGPLSYPKVLLYHSTDTNHGSDFRDPPTYFGLDGLKMWV